MYIRIRPTRLMLPSLGATLPLGTAASSRFARSLQLQLLVFKGIILYIISSLYD